VKGNGELATALAEGAGTTDCGTSGALVVTGVGVVGEGCSGAGGTLVGAMGCPSGLSETAVTDEGVGTGAGVSGTGAGGAVVGTSV